MDSELRHAVFPHLSFSRITIAKKIPQNLSTPISLRVDISELRDACLLLHLFSLSLRVVKARFVSASATRERAHALPTSVSSEEVRRLLPESPLCHWRSVWAPLLGGGGCAAPWAPGVGLPQACYSTTECNKSICRCVQRARYGASCPNKSDDKKTRDLQHVLQCLYLERTHVASKVAL